MIYFDFEESFLVAGLIIIMLVIGWFTLSLILRQQRKMLFLHPGWIMVTLPVIYGVSTPFFILIGKAKRFGLNPDLLGFYNFNNVLLIMLMYTITLLGFFVAQGFISTINSPVATKQKGRMINGRGDWFLTKTASKVLTFLLLCIVSLGCVSMISYYSHFGGIKEFLSINRVIRYQELHDLGMYSTFNAFFSIGFLVYTYRLVTSKETSRSNWLLMVLLFSFYFFQQTITGSRLGVTTLALGIGFVVFTAKPNLIIENKRALLIISSIIISFFVVWQAGRSIVPMYLLTGHVDWTLVAGSDFSRGETVTGYIPGLIMLYVGKNQFRALYVARVFTFSPALISRFLGITKPEPLSVLISPFQNVRRGSSIYTVTLPIDIYMSMGMVGVFVISLLLYLLFYYVIKRLVAKGNISVVLAGIVFMNLFYVIRVEVGNWVSKMLSNTLVFCIFVGLYLFLINMFGSEELRAD